MIVAITGDLELNTPQDKEFTFNLIESLKAKYANLIIVSVACEGGIGEFVRGRCIVDRQNPDIPFVEISSRPWAIIPRTALVKFYMSRNAALEEVAEEFHVITTEKRQDHVRDLIDRLHRSKIAPPLYVHHPTGTIKTFNVVEQSDQPTNTTQDTMNSENITSSLEFDQTDLEDTE